MGKSSKKAKKHRAPPKSNDVSHPAWAVAAHDEPPRVRVPNENDATVLTYMTLMTTFYPVIKGERDPRSRRQAIEIWGALKEARLFHFETSTYAAVHNEVDIWVTEVLAGFEWRSQDAEAPPPEETEAMMKVIERECKNAPYPERFPFPSTFIGYGNGVYLPDHTLRMKAPLQMRDELREGWLVGHLMTEDGFAVGFYEAVTDDWKRVVFIEVLRSKNMGWIRHPINLEPWILPHLIQIINEHRTFLVQTPMTTNLRHQYKNERKSMGLKPHHWAYTPPPYYKLPLKTQVIQEKVRKTLSRPRNPVGYRTDVRAHERCRIMRGKLPLDPVLRAKLTKRGYKIFTTNPLDKDTLYRLQERVQPFKKADEWLAILTSWIDSHYTNNDPKLPYVPACRLPGNVRTKPRSISHAAVHDPASTGTHG